MGLACSARLQHEFHIWALGGAKLEPLANDGRITKSASLWPLLRLHRFVDLSSQNFRAFDNSVNRTESTRIAERLRRSTPPEVECRRPGRHRSLDIPCQVGLRRRQMRSHLCRRYARLQPADTGVPGRFAALCIRAFSGTGNQRSTVACRKQKRSRHDADNMHRAERSVLPTALG